MEQEHPSIDFHCPVTDEHITLGFGYLHNEPMMPIFKGEADENGVADLVAMIPREVLIAALNEGWGELKAVGGLTLAKTKPSHQGTFT